MMWVRTSPDSGARRRCCHLHKAETHWSEQLVGLGGSGLVLEPFVFTSLLESGEIFSERASIRLTGQVGPSLYSEPKIKASQPLLTLVC